MGDEEEYALSTCMSPGLRVVICLVPRIDATAAAVTTSSSGSVSISTVGEIQHPGFFVIGQSANRPTTTRLTSGSS